MSSLQMTPELKRAIIKYVPKYFSWDVARQEEYRVDKPEETAFQIRRFLLKELFGTSVNNEDEMEDAEGSMSDVQCSALNGAMLPLQGIGEDYFYLNEHFASSKSVLSFPTLYDYDFDDFQFQEKCRLRDSDDYQTKSYHGSLYLTWARLMIDGKFSYAVISMLAGHIYSELDEFGYEYLEKLIPYEFKPGKNHGKKTKNGYLHDMKQDAGGMEGQLEELTHRFWDYLQNNLERIKEECSRESRQEVFIVDASRKGDPSHQFIFTDKDVLSRINLKSFMADCRKVEQVDHSIMVSRVDKEKERMRQFFDEQYADIMANYDPKIVKLRKKRKVVIHEDADLDGLLDL